MSSEYQDSPRHGVENNALSAPQDIPAESCPKPRRSKVMTLKKLYVQIRLGFGQGHGSDYQPWLKIRRKNSSPNSNQVVSWMPQLGRAAHYFSHGEFHSALLLLWLGVQDLREQYPLWPMPHPHPLSGTPGAGAEALKLKWSRGLLAIAEDAGIKHGVEVGTHIPYVATIDLLATVRLVDGVRLIGFSSKPISDVDDEIKQRTLERLEMERRYFAEINAGYFVSSSSLVPSLMAGQLECWLDYAHGRLVGPRLSATPIREKIEISLAQGEEVVLDFSGVEATQSFIDGLVGVLVLQHGPDVLGRLVFKSCSDDVKAILQFVAADRCDQYLKAHSH